MKAAYRDEAAYKDEDQITPRIVRTKAVPEPRKTPLRYDLWEFAERRARANLYIPSESDEDVDEYVFVLGFADDAMDTLQDLYEFRNYRAIAYLANNPSLYKLLEEAHEKIRKYFGPDARVVLDAIKDSEMDENERLFAFVQTNLSADDALDHLDELYEQWWLDRLSTIQPKMSIDVEFV